MAITMEDIIKSNREFKRRSYIGAVGKIRRSVFHCCTRLYF